MRVPSENVWVAEPEAFEAFLAMVNSDEPRETPILDELLRRESVFDEESV